MLNSLISLIYNLILKSFEKNLRISVKTLNFRSWVTYDFNEEDTTRLNAQIYTVGGQEYTTLHLEKFTVDTKTSSKFDNFSFQPGKSSYSCGT